MDNTVVAALQPISVSAVVADYAELFKLRVNSLVVLTSWCGAYLAMGHFSWPSLVHIVVGIGSVAGGTAALNEVLERDSDGKMLRTARRPLVTGRISISAAVFLGVGLVIGGVFYLVILANVLTGALALLTSVVYLFVYTPWKTYGPACTAVGAIPGAMPVVLGWASAGGAMDSRALLLFSILYLWQFPHFHAIALLYREDYRRAGIQMLAVVDRSGRRIATQILACSFFLVAVSMIPYVLHLSGIIYVVFAAVSGVWLCSHAIRLCRALYGSSAVNPSLSRALLRATIIYLPLMLGAWMGSRLH
ncbi:MAG: heme o synthase [Candidatus Sulfotelmatobacter sp.]